MELRSPKLALALLRAAVGAVFFLHGWAKIFFGFRGPLATLLAQWSVPQSEAVAWAIAVVELVGGVLFALGVFWQFFGAVFALEMAIAIARVHGPIGWYVVGPGRNGAEFCALLLAALATLFIGGPGWRPFAEAGSRKPEA